MGFITIENKKNNQSPLTTRQLTLNQSLCAAVWKKRYSSTITIYRKIRTKCKKKKIENMCKSPGKN